MPSVWSSVSKWVIYTLKSLNLNAILMCFNVLKWLNMELLKMNLKILRSDWANVIPIVWLCDYFIIGLWLRRHIIKKKHRKPLFEMCQQHLRMHLENMHNSNYPFNLFLSSNMFSNGQPFPLAEITLWNMVPQSHVASAGIQYCAHFNWRTSVHTPSRQMEMRKKPNKQRNCSFSPRRLVVSC